MSFDGLPRVHTRRQPIRIVRAGVLSDVDPIGTDYALSHGRNALDRGEPNPGIRDECTDGETIVASMHAASTFCGDI